MRRLSPATDRLLLFGLPALLGLAGRAIKGRWWLNDFDAVACAAWRVAHHASPYAQDLACPGGRPAAYVYAPQLAWALAPFAGGPDVSTLRLVYGLAYAVVTAWLFWTLFLRRTPGASTAERAPFLSLCAGSAVACGNLATPSHALVLAAGLAGSPFLLGVAILAVALIKPVYLTYLLVFAYADAPLGRRALWLAASLAGAVVLAAIVAATGGSALSEWRGALDAVVVGQQTGVGLLDLLARFGLRAGQPLAVSLWLAFAALISLAGLILVETRALDRTQRLLVAIALAQLCDPRLMDYDLVMMAPGLAIVAGGDPRLRRAGFAICILTLLLGVAEQKVLAIRLGPGLLALWVIWAAARTVRATRAAWPAWGPRPATEGSARR